MIRYSRKDRENLSRFYHIVIVFPAVARVEAHVQWTSVATKNSSDGRRNRVKRSFLIDSAKWLLPSRGTFSFSQIRVGFSWRIRGPFPDSSLGRTLPRVRHSVFHEPRHTVSTVRLFKNRWYYLYFLWVPNEMLIFLFRSFGLLFSVEIIIAIDFCSRQWWSNLW